MEKKKSAIRRNKLSLQPIFWINLTRLKIYALCMITVIYVFTTGQTIDMWIVTWKGTNEPLTGWQCSASQTVLIIWMSSVCEISSYCILIISTFFVHVYIFLYLLIKFSNFNLVMKEINITFFPPIVRFTQTLRNNLLNEPILSSWAKILSRVRGYHSLMIFLSPFLLFYVMFNFCWVIFFTKFLNVSVSPFSTGPCSIHHCLCK